MATIREAGYVYCGEEDGAVIVGFADKQFGTEQYVLLQRLKAASDEERDSGDGEVHITIDDQSRSKYGGIRTVEVAPGVVRIHLEQESARLLDTDDEIVIRFLASESEHDAMVDCLKDLVSGTQSRILI